MDTIKEVFGSVFESLRDRLGNPLVGSYIFAWLLWNFRLVLVLIGDGSGGWAEKIAYIDNKLMVSSWDWFLHGLAMSLLFSCLWVFCFPFVSRQILVFDRAQRFRTSHAILKAEEKKPILEGEAMQLRIRLRDDREAWEKERILLLKEIESLEARIRPSSTGDVGVEKNATESLKALPNAIELTSTTEMEYTPLGVRFAKPNTSAENSSGHITFQGQPIVWPWAVDTSKQPDLPRSIQVNLKDAVLSEEALLVLYLVRDEENFTHQGLAFRAELDSFSAKVATDELAGLGLIQGPFGNGEQYAITSAGRMVLAWLLRKGFRFHEDEPPF